MSKSTNKQYCNLFTFIKDHNPKLVEISEDLCADGLFRGRGAKTFLNPDSSMVGDLNTMINSGKSTEALTKLKSLFLEGCHNNLDSSKQYVTFNFKEVTGLKNKVSDKFKKWESDICVHDVSEFPKEGKEVPKKSKSSKKTVEGSGELSYVIKVTNDLIQKYNVQKDMKVFIYAVNSLLSFIKQKDASLFETLKNKIDPNMLLTWYIIVHPSAKSNFYIPVNLFNEWAQNVYNLPNKNAELVKSILNDDNTVNIKRSLEERSKLKNVINSGKVVGSEILNEIKKAYNGNMVKLLEDELRFSNTDVDVFDCKRINEFSLINWEEPEKYLTILTIVNSPSSELIATFQKFIDSNAFLYTVYNNTVIEKIKSRISGAGNSASNAFHIFGGSLRNEIDTATGSGESFSLKHFVGGLTSSQLEELKSYLSD